MMKKLLWVILLLPVYILANGLFFDGLDNFVDISSVGHNPEINADYTLDLWFNPADINGDYTIFSSNLNNDRYCVSMSNENLLVRIYDNLGKLISESKYANKPIEISINGWHHLVIIFGFQENDEINFSQKIFLDGSLASVELFPKTNKLMTPIFLGTVLPNIGPCFTGGIDEIRVWNRSLSLREIKELSNRSPLQTIAPDYFARFNIEPNTLEFADEDSISLLDPSDYPVILNGVQTRSTADVSLPPSLSFITDFNTITATNFELGSAYPNPFNPSTTINFCIAIDSKVQINIFDMRGSLINNLTNRNYSAGKYNVVWNGLDFNNNQVSSGTYIYQMITNTGYSQSAKMVLIK